MAPTSTASRRQSSTGSFPVMVEGGGWSSDAWPLLSQRILSLLLLFFSPTACTLRAVALSFFASFPPPPPPPASSSTKSFSPLNKNSRLQVLAFCLTHTNLSISYGKLEPSVIPFANVCLSNSASALRVVRRFVRSGQSESLVDPILSDV